MKKVSTAALVKKVVFDTFMRPPRSEIETWH